jgi:hypothetical protein
VVVRLFVSVEGDLPSENRGLELIHELGGDNTPLVIMYLHFNVQLLAGLEGPGYYRGCMEERLAPKNGCGFRTKFLEQTLDHETSHRYPVTSFPFRAPHSRSSNGESADQGRMVTCMRSV